MNRTTLDILGSDALAEAFNLVYEGYVMPVQVPPEWIERHVHFHDIDLAHSPLWLADDGGVVGLAMLGVRGNRGWIASFGIAPAHRGKGLSRGLMEEVVATASRLGLRRLQLEVIVGNDRAIRTYERAGFVHHRDLLILTRDPGARMIEVDTSAVRPVDPKELLDYRARSSIAEPPWQREPASLLRMSRLEALAIGPADAPLAFAVYLNSQSEVRLLDIGMIDLVAGQSVVAELVSSSDGQPITLVNQPDGSDAPAVLEDAGWREEMRQYEMVRER